MFTKITTNLMVTGVNETLDFYLQVLGFGFVVGVVQGSQQMVTTWDGGDVSLGFALIRRDDVDLMIQSQESLSQELPEFGGQSVGGTFTLYVEVADVKGLYERIRNKVTILSDLHTTFYGAEEFYIRDCNGYVLAFATR